MKYSTFFRVTTAEYKGFLIIIAHFSAGVLEEAGECRIPSKRDKSIFDVSLKQFYKRNFSLAF